MPRFDRPKKKRRSRIYSVPDEEFTEIVAAANNYSDCLRALGLSTDGGSSTDILKQRIKELGCSTSHFKGKVFYVNQQKPIETILVEKSTYANTNSLKLRIIREGLMKYECAFCGNKGEWLGRKMSLQLDHINGVNNDNRLHNLRLLCPNCHSITNTYSGKNKNKKV